MDVDDSEDMDAVDEIMGTKNRKTRTPASSQNATPKSKRKPVARSSVTSGSELYSSLKGGAIVSTIVSGWLDDYQSKKSKAQAVAALISLILQMASIDQEIPVELVEESDEATVAQFAKESIEVDLKSALPEFPLQSKVKKGLVNGYSRFWRELVDDGSESAWNDEYLLSRVTTWLHALIESPLRPLRHAAAVTSFHLCRELLHQLEECEKQMKKKGSQGKDSKESGGAEKGKQAAAQRVAKENEKRLQKQVTIFEGMAKQIWDLVFVKSWNDKDMNVRQLCVTAFGEWCIQSPRLYMEYDRFKFLVWLSADSESAIRILAIETLTDLLEHAPLRPQLSEYCTHLSDRLLSRTRETNEHMVAAAAKLFATLRRHFGANYLNEEVSKELKLLISADSAPIRRAVGELVLLDIMEAAPKVHKNILVASQLQSQNVQRLRALVDFIETSTAHPELPAYVIDAIWDNKPEFLLFQFSDFAALLTAPASSRLPESQQILLFKIVASTLAQLNGKAPFKTTGKPVTAQVLTQLNLRFTNCFYSIMTPLLTTNKSDDIALVPLLAIVQFLDLGILGSRTDGYTVTTQYALILKMIFLTTTSEEVMKKAGGAFDHLLSDTSFKHRRLVETPWRNLVDELVVALRGMVEQFGEPGSSQVAKPKNRASDLKSASFVDGLAPLSAPLVICLLRLEALSFCFDLTQLDDSLLGLTMKILETRHDGLLTLVGPRSASSAANLTTRLLIHQLNAWILDENLDESRISETQDYDVSQRSKQKDDNDSSSEMELTDTPSRNRAMRRTKEVDEEQEEGKSKKKRKVRLYGSIGLSKVPSEEEMKNLAENVEKAVEWLGSLLSRTADDSDVSDLAPKSAFLSITSLLCTFSPALEETPLKTLVYRCDEALASKLATAFDLELETMDSKASDYQERLLSILSAYYAACIVGALGEKSESALKRCLAQLNHSFGLASRMVRSMLSQLRKLYTTPAQYAQILVDALDFEFERQPASPNTPALETDEKEQEVAHLARKLAMSLPLAKEFTPTCAKLVLDKLVQVVLLQPDLKSNLLLWASLPFISKLTPSAARDLVNSLTRYVDHSVKGLGEDVEGAYEALKTAVKERASGRRAQPAADAQDEEDGDSDGEAPVRVSRAKKTAPKKKSAAKRSATPAKRAAARPARGARSSVIHQGDDEDSITGDSEMAHTEDEASSVSMDEETSRTPARRAPKRTSARAKETSAEMETDAPIFKKPTSTPSRAAKNASSMDIDEESMILPQDDGASEREETSIMDSQVSVEMPLTDDAELVEPASSRPKRGRPSRASQPSEPSAAESDEEESPAPPTPKRITTRSSAANTPKSSQRSIPSRSASKASQRDQSQNDEDSDDSEDLMSHTPVAKKRTTPSRAVRR
jgi:hypothetical protein